MTYTNTSKTTKTVNGKTSDIYSPFVMVTGMILSTDNFSNVTVDNGKVISDGSRNVVVGFGMPGMKESLNMSSDIADEVDIPEGFTVEADVTDCEMSSSFTVALTDILKDINLDDVDGLEIEKIGPSFESHVNFPDRVNTEFVKVIDRHTVQMRVWERGSGETLACGTGACAVAVASILNGLVDRDRPVTICLCRYGRDGPHHRPRGLPKGCRGRGHRGHQERAPGPSRRHRL